jgi:predicted SAM-dependent methyltransferase
MIRSSKSRRALYVQYGCGLSAPKDWINFDASPRLRFERLPIVGALALVIGKRLFPPNVTYGDIVQGLPLRDETVDAIYASHVLEHLSRRDVVRALTNTFRLLRPGGVFRMIVPDLGWRVRRYQETSSKGDAGAADNFITSCLIGDTERPRGILALLRSSFGNSGHSWMYDEQLMRRLLDEAGFIQIRRCDFGDSTDPMFVSVENRERFYDDGERELAFEALKP